MTNKPKHPVVAIKTSLGDFKVELYEDKAPLTVKNFLDYVESGHYKGTIFHRVIDGFMIQGGGLTKDMKQKENRAAIQNEAHNGLSNKKGTLAMARTSDIHSATSQFFINVADNKFLDHREKSSAGYGYCVFGQVIEGIDIVEKIKDVDTHSMGHHQDVPTKPIEILEISKVS